jgi:hypothetical protein
MIIQEKEKYVNTNTTLLVVARNDLSYSFGNELPYPQKHFMSGNVFKYFWNINGFFGTNKSINYMNDIKARLHITFKNTIVETKHYNNYQSSTLELSHFQGLKSIAINIINKTNRYDNTKDFIFWCLKLYAEDMIRESGVITYDILFQFAENNFWNDLGTRSCKDYSTLKAKCRSIVNYYICKEYRLDKYVRKLTDEEYKMTRSQNMKRIKKRQAEETKKKVEHFMSGLFIDDYKKPNGKWNKSKIADALGITRPTLDKYLM